MAKFRKKHTACTPPACKPQLAIAGKVSTKMAQKNEISRFSHFCAIIEIVSKKADCGMFWFSMKLQIGHLTFLFGTTRAGYIKNSLNDQLPVGLIAQLVRALHRYRRGHGFESRSSLNFFQA